MSDVPTDPTPAAAWDPVSPAATVRKERGFFGELLLFAWENKWWWIAPTLVILGGLTVLIVAAGNQRIVPFFYAVF